MKTEYAKIIPQNLRDCLPRSIGAGNADSGANNGAPGDRPAP